MNAHTPGPWRYVELQSRNHWASIVVSAADPESPKDERDVATLPHNSIANARLIAAAPDLLNALREVCDAIDQYAPMENVALNQVWQKGLAAIAKATP